MPAPRFALIAPEMATHGGVQSFMWRVWESMSGTLAADAKVALGVVNDSEEALRATGRVASSGRVFGARRSKLAFVMKALRLPCSDVMIVGHIGQAPVALVLKALGRLRHYAVILHGIEAWKRVPPLQRLACRSAFFVVATTRFTARTFAEHNRIDPRRLRVLPLCADEHPRARSHLILSGTFRILVVGRQHRTERSKGYLELIGALALMRAGSRPATLHVVGDGDDQAALRERARACGVEEHVIFHGALGDADLEAAYASCDVYAMPSRKEGFGIVFLEAMRHAKACVGARAGGIPEVIEEGVTGVLVPYGDTHALAEALSRLHDDPQLRQRLGAAGLHKVQTVFSSAAFRANYRDLILEMLAG